MKTRDGHEIKVNDTLHTFNGEQLVVKDLFNEESGKLIVTPIFLVESMYASGDGGYHREIDVECEYEAEDKIVESKDVFLRAPTAVIDKKIQEKQIELNDYCTKIGIAKVELIAEQERVKREIIDLNDKESKARAALESVKETLKSAIGTITK